MAIEKLFCRACQSTYKVEWDEDEQIEFFEPDFCPMCGSELGEDYYDEEDLEE